MCTMLKHGLHAHNLIVHTFSMIDDSILGMSHLFTSLYSAPVLSKCTETLVLKINFSTGNAIAL